MTTAPEQVKKPRRRRQRVTLPTGEVRTIAKEPRADVLHYPASGWTTVLVRRTHDPELAHRLAAKRWAEIGEDAPLTVSRTGWWATVPARRGQRPPDHAAVDQHDRFVTSCDWQDRNASPGIEWRAGAPRADDPHLLDADRYRWGNT